MRLSKVDERNHAALEKVAEFRRKSHPEHFGEIDQTFHWYKNHFPFFGFIEVEIGDQNFVMFSGNDDLVAMTYFWHGPSAFEAHSMNLWASCAVDAHHVLDIGAFSGVYSLLAASINPRCDVVAFEPSRRTHGRLLLNIHLNGFETRIKSKTVAVSNVSDEVHLLQFRGENVLGNGASLLEKDIPVTDGSEIVETVVLDDLCRRESVEPDLIKIDVEGAEALVLDGMEHILSAHRPNCLVEVTPRTIAPVKEIFARHAYDLALIDDKSMSLSACDHGVSKVSNVLATPKSR